MQKSIYSMENSWEKPKHTIFIYFLAIALLLSTGLTIFVFNILSQTYAASTATANCPMDFMVKINNVYSSTTVPPTINVNGLTPVDFGATSLGLGTVQKVVIYADNNPIGVARSTSTYSWRMPWASNLMPYGLHEIHAEATTSNGVTCRTSSLNVNTSTAAASLVLATTPTNWTATAGSAQTILIKPTVYVPENNFDATNYAIYEYSKTIGVLTPNEIGAQLLPGNIAGNGMAVVNVKYGGKTAQITVPIQILPASAPNISPNTTPTPTKTGSLATNATGTTPNPTPKVMASPTLNPTPTRQQQTAALRATLAATDSLVQNCSQKALGDDKFNAINSGASRPTSEELNKIKACYASTNNIIPSNFAPISPKNLSSLPLADKIEMSKPINVEKSVNNTKKQTLKFSGKAKANSTVVLYLFSNPIVLVTTADSSGNWEYSLEDPIETGKHEVYAVVDRGDGVYEKSNPFDFIIGKATAASDNPENVSLTLADTATPAQSNRSTLIYILGSAVSVLVIGLLSLLLILNINHKKSKIRSSKDTTPPTQTISPNQGL